MFLKVQFFVFFPYEEVKDAARKEQWCHNSYPCSQYWKLKLTVQKNNKKTNKKNCI